MSAPNSSPAKLPELLVLSDVVVSAPAVVLRAKHEPPQIRRDLARLSRCHTDCLILASMIEPIADGIHLAAQDEPQHSWPTPYTGIVGRSCHNLDEVRAAELEGVHYVTLSPIFPTESKPGYGPALGLNELRHVAGQTRLPVYALGGVHVGRVAACRAAGATGVAVQGAVARSSKPQAAIQAILAEWQLG
ncbi:MAG: thiamine phosphate synthase [bacterium]|nr:thiamine phosphate synthase [bacterium]